MYSLDDLGTFVSLRPSSHSLDELQALQKVLDLPNPVTRDALHCTVVDSAKTMRGYTAWGEIWPCIRACPISIQRWPWMVDRECVVLTLNSDDIVVRNQRLVDIYNIPPSKYPFAPHITLAYGTEGCVLPDAIQSVLPSITFVKEYSIACCSDVRDFILQNLNTGFHV